MSTCTSSTSSKAVLSLALIVATLVPAMAQAQASLSLDEKLAAIRQGFVKAAIEGPTTVQSTVWIDSSGALQEISSFRTGMEVRGVKVLSYARDDLGQPTAALSWKPKSETKTELPSAKAAVSCSAGSLKHVIGFEINSGEKWGVDEVPALRTVTNLLTQHWSRSTTGHVHWAQRTGSTANRTAYEKAFLGSSVDAMPWRADLTLRPSPKRTEPGLLSFFNVAVKPGSVKELEESNIQLHITLTARNQQTPAFEATADFAWQLETQNWSAPMPSVESQQVLVQQIKTWSAEIYKMLACETVMPEVILAASESLRINSGRLAGLRVGDEMLLADGKNYVKKILEPGMISESVIAKVLTVGDHHAHLQVSAGAKPSVQLGWRAWTTELSP